MADCDAVVHAVGVLFDNKKPERGYVAMNRDSCINMASILQNYASEKNDKRNFVMISASRSIPFIPAYLATK